MELGITKRSLKALRRIRDRERLSMNILCTTLGVLRDLCAPYIPKDDFEATVVWFDKLGEDKQRELLDDAFGVTALKQNQRGAR